MDKKLAIDILEKCFNEIREANEGIRLITTALKNDLNQEQIAEILNKLKEDNPI